MKITTVTRITMNRNEDREKFDKLMHDPDWIIYEGFGPGFVTFEKISEVIDINTKKNKE